MIPLTKIDDNGKVTIEWINNTKYISHSPHPNHGVVYSELFNQLFNYVKGKDYMLFPGSTDLIIANPNKPINISDLKRPVVPDLFIVRDNNFEIVGNTIVAIPDFICEVVSPCSIKMVLVIKKDYYLSKGTTEYWVVNYLDNTITVFYDSKELTYSFNENIRVNIFRDFIICLKDIELF